MFHTQPKAAGFFPSPGGRGRGSGLYHGALEGERYERAMLARAQAATLLKERGYDLSELLAGAWTKPISPIPNALRQRVAAQAGHHAPAMMMAMCEHAETHETKQAGRRWDSMKYSTQ
jgi:hypothetical protein